MSVTFSTCWYNFKSKFPTDTYLTWIDNMLSNVNNYYLVIYSDLESSPHLLKYLNNPRIILVIKPVEDFYNYKYKTQWIQNHQNNPLLNDRVDWKVNMLWCEKVHFVHETMQRADFNTDYYGWCDIGYFRCGAKDLSKDDLVNWPSNDKIKSLNQDKIYYAIVNRDRGFIDFLYNIINDKNANGLPKTPIPPYQFSIAGGFFVSHRKNIEWWRDTFDSRLSRYFQNDYLVKDDQIIVVDCVFSEISRFILCQEDEPAFDNWFLFQRFLL